MKRLQTHAQAQAHAQTQTLKSTITQVQDLTEIAAESHEDSIKLEVFDLAGRTLQIFVINQAEFTLGRSQSESQYVIEEAKISKKHLLIRRHSTGVTLEDLQSSNGTYYEDQKFSQLKLGLPCRVRLGPNIEIELKLAGAQTVAGFSQNAPNWTRKFGISLRPSTLATSFWNLVEETNLQTHVLLLLLGLACNTYLDVFWAKTPVSRSLFVGGMMCLVAALIALFTSALSACVYWLFDKRWKFKTPFVLQLFGLTALLWSEAHFEFMSFHHSWGSVFFFISALTTGVSSGVFILGLGVAITALRFTQQLAVISSLIGVLIFAIYFWLKPNATDDLAALMAFTQQNSAKVRMVLPPASLTPQDYLAPFLDTTEGPSPPPRDSGH